MNIQIYLQTKDRIKIIGQQINCLSIVNSLLTIEMQSLHQSIDKVKAETKPVCNILITLFSG